MKIMIMRHEIIKGNLLTEFSEWIFLNATTIKRVIQGALIYYYSRSAYFLTNFLRLRFFFFRFFFFVPGLRLPRLCSCRLFGCWFACKEELDGNFLLDNRGQCQTFDDDDSTLDSAWKIPRAEDIHTFKTLIWMPETKMEVLYLCLLCEDGHQGVVELLLDYTLIIACKNGCKDVVNPSLSIKRNFALMMTSVLSFWRISISLNNFNLLKQRGNFQHNHAIFSALLYRVQCQTYSELEVAKRCWHYRSRTCI